MHGGIMAELSADLAEEIRMLRYRRGVVVLQPDTEDRTATLRAIDFQLPARETERTPPHILAYNPRLECWRGDDWQCTLREPARPAGCRLSPLLDVKKT